MSDDQPVFLVAQYRNPALPEAVRRQAAAMIEVIMAWQLAQKRGLGGAIGRQLALNEIQTAQKEVGDR